MEDFKKKRGKKRTFPTEEAIINEARRVLREKNKFSQGFLKEHHPTFFSAIVSKKSVLVGCPRGRGGWFYVARTIGLTPKWGIIESTRPNIWRCRRWGWKIPETREGFSVRRRDGNESASKVGE